jgi:CelD/BcsL family acetyltransferase involved in cellulose biosynthesis
MKNITVTIIKSVEEFRSLQNEWEAILQSNSLKSIFLTWDLLFTWWNHYGRPEDLWILQARAGGELVGIAPLMMTQRRKRGKNFRVLQTLGTPHVDVGGFLIKADSQDALKAICQFILEQSGAWDMLELNEFQQEHPQSKLIVDFFNNAGTGLATEKNSHYYLPVAGEWDNFFRSLSRNLRKDINRRMRRAEEAADLKFERVRSADITNNHLDIIFNLNEKGNFPDLYRTENDRAFHRDLIDMFRNRQMVEIYIVYLDNIPAAFQYGFIYDNRYEDWRGSMDLQYRLLSVGKLLLCHSLKDRFDDKIKEVDFLRGDYGYKEEWEPQIREYLQINVTSGKNILAFLNFIFLPRFRRQILSLKFVQSISKIFRSRPALTDK